MQHFEEIFFFFQKETGICAKLPQSGKQTPDSAVVSAKDPGSNPNESKIFFSFLYLLSRLLFVPHSSTTSI